MSRELPNYYAVLGIVPSASDEQIRRAYLELAKQHHPDVTGEQQSGKQIKRINTAFRILSDPAKRRRYDAQRRHLTGSSPPRRTRRPPDIERGSRPAQTIDLPITPEESLHGATVSAILKVELPCPVCAGQAADRPCRRCQGAGRVSSRRPVQIRIPRRSSSGTLIPVEIPAPPHRPREILYVRLTVRPYW